jgi:hypothetical protein
MNQKEYVPQMMKSGQTLFNNAYDLTVLLQDQYEKIARTLLDQAEWLPAENRKTIDNCADAYKTGRNQFKNYMDETYKQVENYFR